MGKLVDFVGGDKETFDEKDLELLQQYIMQQVV